MVECTFSSGGGLWRESYASSFTLHCLQSACVVGQGHRGASFSFVLLVVFDVCKLLFDTVNLVVNGFINLRSSI
jgi:hypothetical protein